MVQLCPQCEAINPDYTNICYSCGREFKTIKVKPEKKKEVLLWLGRPWWWLVIKIAIFLEKAICK